MSLRAPYGQGDHGTMWLALDPQMFDAFPQEITWNGENFFKKKELHVTLLHAKSARELAGVSNEALAEFLDSFVEVHPITLVSLLDDFRSIEENGQKTIVVRCTVSHLEELFAQFNKDFNANLPIQAAHVTLYLLRPDKVGIHINSEEKMESLERVHLPELSTALSKIHAWYDVATVSRA